MPKGFPFAHPRFWMNSFLPPASIAVCILGVIAVVRERRATVKQLTLGFGTVLIVGGIAAECFFPQSVSGALLVAVATCSVFGLLLVAGALWGPWSAPAAGARGAMCVIVGVVVGLFIPWSQRGADPATRPAGSPIPSLPFGIPGSAQSMRLSDRVTTTMDMQGVVADYGRTAVRIHPLLSFRSRSPDRFWTVFAPRSARRGPPRVLTGVVRDEESVTLSYQDDGLSRLRIDASDPRGAVRIEALSDLPRPVYSHLNSSCQLHISSHGKLALQFSPCREVVEIKPFDYPVGTPARLAYMDAHGVFRVVEAHSGEKGPFTTLTQGPLEDDEPLSITILADGELACRVTLYDWATQASTQLSPTAGWGLPENAIEFSLADEGEGFVFITLAGTSVGRGFDSVGHTPGVYRNTMTIEPVPAQE